MRKQTVGCHSPSLSRISDVVVTVIKSALKPSVRFTCLYICMDFFLKGVST